MEDLEPTVICIVESWLSTEISDFEISLVGYALYRLDQNRHGGGVIIYVKPCVTSELPMTGSPNLEFLSVSISSPPPKLKHCILLFYRPPSSPANIFDSLLSIVHNINPSSFSTLVLIGDFNVDFCNPSHPLSPKLHGFYIPFHFHKQSLLQLTLNQIESHLSLIWLCYQTCLNLFSAVLPHLLQILTTMASTFY